LPPLPAWQPPRAIREDDPARFLAGVERVHEYLRAGDTFQVNLSRKWSAEFAQAPEPAALYARLRAANPAPFAGLLAYEDWALASSSPERLVSVRGKVVETRPIAGRGRACRGTTTPRASASSSAIRRNARST
jgi:anthranilate synthase component 1